MCPQATLRSLEESLEGGRAVLGMVMCGRVWSCVVVCGRVSFSHAHFLQRKFLSIT